MSRTVTLRLSDNSYKIFQTLAQEENRTMSNFIQTSVLRFIEKSQFVDDYEMEGIINNEDLNKSLKRAHKDVGVKEGVLLNSKKRTKNPNAKS